MDERGKDERRRKAVRLPAYDYSSPGAYFITICCAEMKHLFGSVEDGQVRLSKLGHISADGLARIESRSNALADTYIVMPNHIHAIIFIEPQRFMESLQNAGRPWATPTGSDRQHAHFPPS